VGAERNVHQHESQFHCHRHVLGQSGVVCGTSTGSWNGKYTMMYI
jgi:hypothetical protein